MISTTIRKDIKMLGALLASWLVCTNAQIVFPDQFAILQNAQSPQANDPPAKAPFPSLPSSQSFDSSSSDSNSFVPQNGIRRAEDSSISGFQAGQSAPSGSSWSSPMFGSAGNIQDAEAQYWSNHVNTLISRGVTKFTLDMDRAIHRTQKTRSAEKENVVFSPLSLVGTLAMVLLGSAGVTFDEVSRILGLEAGVDISAHSEIVHQMFGLLLDSVDPKTNAEGPRTTIASGVFVQTGYPIRPEFKAISQHVYKNEVINLDFIGHSSQARQSINDWVKTRTNGKITGILTQSLDPDTRLILASALYFSGEWARHFIRTATRRKSFMISPTESVMVDMMYTGGDYPFYEDKQMGVKIVALPYKGHDSTSAGPNYKPQAAMYVLLPTSRSEQALSSLEARLTPEILEGMIGKMVNETCVLGLPRMKLSSTLNLNDALNSLGLRSLFDPSRSNLGLLSPGYDSIFTRIGEGGGGGGGDGPAAGNATRTPARKNHYFRYEDKKGGYRVKQWDSGVIIEKIRRSARRRRSASEGEENKRRNEKEMTKKNRSAATKTREAAETYELPQDSKDKAKVKVVGIGDSRYKFASSGARSKRQSRPIDESFVRFIESRETYRKFGLDELRNSQNVANPGLFASDVLHKVEMDVTETGTVAAAATTIFFQRGGDIKRLVAERPFLFFIRHEPSRLILFWGTVNKPTPNY